MDDIGRMAYMDGVWYEIIDIREGLDGEYEYNLYTKDYWVPKRWVEEIKPKD